MNIKRSLKNICKAAVLSLSCFFGTIFAFFALYTGDNDEFMDLIFSLIVIGFVILMIGSFFFFESKSKMVPLKEGKMKNYKDYVVIDFVRSGNVVLGMHFYKYKDNKFDDCFFFTFYGRYRFENASAILKKITSFCGNLPFISDRIDNFEYFDKLFVFNNVAVLGNERCAINEYIKIKNIKYKKELQL